MQFQTIPPHDLETALSLGSSEDQDLCQAQYESYPDLFVGGYDGDRLVGVCYGWPFFQARSNRHKMMLEVIALLPEYRSQGHGSRLLEFWESRVAARGTWTVSIGSDVAAFYLKNGCAPAEYCVKVHKADLAPDFRDRGYPISHVGYDEDPLVVLYVGADGAYRPERLQAIREAFNAQGEGIVIFEKTVG